MKASTWNIAGFVIVAFALAACGGSASENAAGGDASASEAASPTQAVSPTQAASPSQSASPSGAASTSDAVADGEVLIKPVGNEMRFEQTSFTVEAGQEVTLTFENVATSPAMQHNVVILNSDDDADVNRVGQAAISAGAASDFVPEDAAVLAYTPLAQPGETVEVTFTAPSEPGAYRYICTFPGHYMVMQGTMTVV